MTLAVRAAWNGAIASLVALIFLCLAWELWRRGVDFQIVDRECGIAASRIAAGLVNPVTGKNFEPSPMIGDFLPEALEFYRWIEGRLGVGLWHPMPIMRLAGNDDEWAKMRAKAARADVEVWVGRELAKQEIGEWLGGFEIRGGGRFDVGSFVDRSREFFQAQGIYRKDEIRFDRDEVTRVWCDGAAGLVSGRHGESRCAKGEILTVRAAGWAASGGMPSTQYQEVLVVVCLPEFKACDISPVITLASGTSALIKVLLPAPEGPSTKVVRPAKCCLSCSMGSGSCSCNFPFKRKGKT